MKDIVNENGSIYEFGDHIRIFTKKLELIRKIKTWKEAEPIREYEYPNGKTYWDYNIPRNKVRLAMKLFGMKIDNKNVSQKNQEAKNS